MRPILLAGLLACATALPAFAADVTIETATGPATLPQAPQTIAVFDAPSVDTIAALGQPIAGLPAPLYLKNIEEISKDATTVGTLFEPDFEALAVMAPDLIIAGGRSATQVEPLSRVAPTIDMTIQGNGMVDQTRARIKAFGTLLNREEQAQALEAQLDDKLAAARDAVAGKGNALVILTNGGKISAFGAGSRFGWIHDAVGLPQAHPGLEADTHGQAISFEFLAETDPDWLLVIDRGAAIQAGSEAAQATLDNPIVARTKAAQNGHIVYLDAAPIYISGGGAHSMMHTLDQLTEAFSDVQG
ncbi:siderophore ABC transporter substrate-binding protein [Salipiger sp. 1_MG-2023]|uniref:siderophore ABC transporter substrate-binding protein n=1 Tax=Salipiger sp. 1_MG-2023 TaxID=3062665 RepID=UPI0026E1CC2B|nr:siderophore ABC transporter substrate-binding protein [Salipiger sp. 1_MG-2023]MDO6585996.1 siderophore ABC transporter substrate-binding protein [Salipiger sp. 1_MG-2023]